MQNAVDDLVDMDRSLGADMEGFASNRFLQSGDSTVVDNEERVVNIPG